MKTVLFIPYAGVTISFDDYTSRVHGRFSEIGYNVISIHNFENPVKAVEEAEVIVVHRNFEDCTIIIGVSRVYVDVNIVGGLELRVV